MKSFFAGLAVGLAAAVVFEERQQGRIRQRTSQAPRERDRRIAQEGSMSFSAGRPEPGRRSSSREEIGTAATQASVANPPEPPPGPPARNPEEVLNSATRQQLLSVYGIGPVLADRIIQNRPYAAAYDVVEQGIIPESIFAQLRKQLLEQPSA